MATKKRVLVVEDDEAFRLLLTNELTEEGIDVLQATNGKDALSVALKEHPDLVLLDIILPKMDGAEVLRGLRDDKEWGQYVPILMLTQLDNMERIAEAVASKVNGYIIKGKMSMEEIIANVKKQLEAPSAL